MFYPLIWKTFCHLDKVNSIETDLLLVTYRVAKKCSHLQHQPFTSIVSSNQGPIPEILAKKYMLRIGRIEKLIFRLFPIISKSQKFFSIFFFTLEKIGIDEKVICYHNISN